MDRFSLYVHIPYCDSKCPYCDFNSHAAKVWPEGAYARALITEMEFYQCRDPWRRGSLRSVFFGGGTPSLFAAETIGEILSAAFRLWPSRSAAALPLEVTLEANPGTVTAEKLSGFVAAGVNRLSFGVQSFTPHHLRRLGRIHSSEQAVQAIRMAHDAGAADVSLDLMFAIPEQTLPEWEADLHRAIALGTDHISAYNLTYEDGTPFADWRRQRRLTPVDEDTEFLMFTRTQEVLQGAGYRQYEISNYARPGHECRHNLNYWSGGDYLGVGAGAHSFSRRPGAGARWSNVEAPQGYLSQVESTGHARVFEEQLLPPQARGEFVFLGLRCRDGFAERDFARRFGVDFLRAFPHAASFQDDGLLDQVDGRWRLSDRGLLLADGLFASFL